MARAGDVRSCYGWRVRAAEEQRISVWGQQVELKTRPGSSRCRFEVWHFRAELQNRGSARRCPALLGCLTFVLALAADFLNLHNGAEERHHHRQHRHLGRSGRAKPGMVGHAGLFGAHSGTAARCTCTLSLWHGIPQPPGACCAGCWRAVVPAVRAPITACGAENSCESNTGTYHNDVQGAHDQAYPQGHKVELQAEGMGRAALGCAAADPQGHEARLQVEGLGWATHGSDATRRAESPFLAGRGQQAGWQRPCHAVHQQPAWSLSRAGTACTEGPARG